MPPSSFKIFYYYIVLSVDEKEMKMTRQRREDKHLWTHFIDISLNYNGFAKNTDISLEKRREQRKQRTAAGLLN